MARALRIERPGGRYHVTARGNERKAIYRDDTDRTHFLTLLEELGERFGAGVHAYVLMDNHFHLLLQTPEANLSRTMQWLNVSYSVWFNRRHDRAGHLFQGRFSAVIIEDDRGWQEVARYVHLNPVRVAALALDKRRRSASRAGVGPAPSAEVVAARLRLLREFRWSSYRAYAGYSAAPPWLCLLPLARLCGGRSLVEQRAALREYHEQAIRQGLPESPWGRLVGGWWRASFWARSPLRAACGRGCVPTGASKFRPDNWNRAPTGAPLSRRWSGPGEKPGRNSASGMATGGVTPRCGWAGGRGGYAWPNWASWPAGWTTRRWARPWPGLAAGWSGSLG